MEATHQGESEKQRTGEPHMLKEITGPNFLKSMENSHFLRVDQSESSDCSISPKIMMWMERNHLMPVKTTI